MTKLVQRTLCVLVVGLFLVGCEHPRNRGPQVDLIAVEFFDRFYNQRDLEHALELTTDDFQALLERYGTINAIGRYLFNMNFDEVVIEADRQGIGMYREQSDTARVQLSFSGTRDNQRVETLRDVVLIRDGSNWRVSRVMEVF